MHAQPDHHGLPFSPNPFRVTAVSVAELLLTLILVWATARLFGELAERVDQPAVLGELLAGVVIGTGALALIDPNQETIHLLAEIGVLILLFEIGLETDLRKLLRVGGAATVVAVTGVVLPLAGGYATGLAVGADPLLALFLGATFTATSVGVTARVLRDLGRLDTPEARVILGAAVVDDVLGLVLLALLTGILSGGTLSLVTLIRILAIALAFLGVALVVGRALAPRALDWLVAKQVQGIQLPFALVLAFAFALCASLAGSAPIVGALVAGLVLAESRHRKVIERDVRAVAHVFVPIFFVVVGAQVDLRPFNPIEPGNWPILAAVLGASLLAIVTKWAAGVAPFWLPLRKNVVGVGMIPRGEVGLIFAQVGLSSGLLTREQFAAVVLVVMITTFVAPILLRRLLKGEAPPPAAATPGEAPTSELEELVGGVD